jgi:hypothetical protein
MSSVPLNPFSDQIVTQPRRAEPAIKGLNDQVLRRLLNEFEKVNSIPRRCGRIQLVVSPAGGYGKSHTTGRLFRDVGRQATRVYVRPSAAPDSCWISLLHSLVQELSGPEYEGTTEQHAFPPTQLDALAHGVFGTLLVGLMDAGEYSYGDPEFVRHRLTKQVFEKWDLSNPDSPWGSWASDMLDTFEKSETRSARLLRLLAELTQDTLSNTTRPQAWMRVLRAYCQDRADASVREFALEWIRARTPRADEGTRPLGIVAADGEDQAAPVAVRNAAARTRVLDLLALAKLFRPFILVFDQTEVFGRVPGMPRAFGSVLSDLMQGEGAHLTIVTANRDVWENELLPAMDGADQDRIAPRLEMLGLTRDQARELAMQRLQQTRMTPEQMETVIAPAWLDEQFASGQVSSRDFLRRCERRFEDVVPAAPAVPAQPAMMLVELYSRVLKRHLEDQRELADFRADVLRWALYEVPARVNAGFLAMPSTNDAPSFISEWRNGDSKRWMIVLEQGSHTLNWLSVAVRAADLQREHPGTVTLAVRTAGQPAIPRPEWGLVGSEIEDVQRSGALHIVTLTVEQLARIYAIWELYTQACQGDIPHEPDSVVRFASQRFQQWYASLRGITAEPKINSEGVAVALPMPPPPDEATLAGAPATIRVSMPPPAPAPVAPVTKATAPIAASAASRNVAPPTPTSGSPNVVPMSAPAPKTSSVPVPAEVVEAAASAPAVGVAVAVAPMASAVAVPAETSAVDAYDPAVAAAPVSQTAMLAEPPSGPTPTALATEPSGPVPSASDRTHAAASPMPVEESQESTHRVEASDKSESLSSPIMEDAAATTVAPAVQHYTSTFSLVPSPAPSPRPVVSPPPPHGVTVFKHPVPPPNLLRPRPHVPTPTFVPQSQDQATKAS